MSPHTEPTPAHRGSKQITKEEMRRLRKKFKGTLTHKQRDELMAASLQRIVAGARHILAAPDEAPYQYDTDEHPDEYRDTGPNYNQDGDEERLASVTAATDPWSISRQGTKLTIHGGIDATYGRHISDELIHAVNRVLTRGVFKATSIDITISNQK